MVAKNSMNEALLADALYDILGGDNATVPDLLYRMASSYVSSMSEDAFRDYWVHYVAEDIENG
jgi:hypothetical protein